MITLKKYFVKGNKKRVRKQFGKPKNVIKPNRVKQIKDLVMQHAPKFEYHNISHIKEVVKTAKLLAKEHGIKEGSRQMQIIETACWLHDFGFKKANPQNEALAAKFAKTILPGFGYSKREVSLIERMILSTKLGVNPINKLERIICDADLANLGRKDFWENSAKVAFENGIKPDSKKSYEISWNLFKNFNFFSKPGRKLYQKHWEKNKKELYKRLNPKMH